MGLLNFGRKKSSPYNRSDLNRVEEYPDVICCGGGKIWVSYKDGPDRRYLICSFCGHVTIYM